jgi:uncharacterized protein (TIGR02147 family)
MSNLFQFNDYREYLKVAFADLKKQNSKYSQRWITQQMGVSSSGWMSDILAGRRSLTTTQIVSLSGVLDHSPKEKAFFEALVFYNQAASLEEKNRYYEQLLTFKEIESDLLDREYLEYFGQWYHAAIREQLLYKPFKGDYTALAASLLPEITPQEAKNSIELLLKLGMINYDPISSEFRPNQVHVKKKTGIDQILFFRYLQANMKLGMESLEKIPKEERYMSALCTGMSQASFKEIQDDIQALRQKIKLLSERDARHYRNTKEPSDMKIFQFLVELFPMTK